VKFLLANGANINAADWEDWTPIVYALRAKGTDCVNYLLDAPDVNLNVISKKGTTLLHDAVIGGNKEVAKRLVDKGVKIITEQKSETGSVLHFACMEGDVELSAFLVQHEPRLVHTRDENEMTPLHIACACNNEEMAIFLINHGSDVNSVATGGTTPLHIAADLGNKFIVEHLISHGAVQKMDLQGHTPIMSAVKAKAAELEALLSKVKIDVETPVKSDDSKTTKPKISADELKEKGNQAFGARDFEMAVHWYSLAIDVDSIMCEVYNRPSALAHVLYSNRSTSQYHLRKYNEALDDANSAIHMAPDWSKGYLRKGAALSGLERKEEAEEAFAKMKELQEKEKNTSS